MSHLLSQMGPCRVCCEPVEFPSLVLFGVGTGFGRGIVSGQVRRVAGHLLQKKSGHKHHFDNLRSFCQPRDSIMLLKAR